MAARMLALGRSSSYLVCLIVAVAFLTPATSRAELLDYSEHAMPTFFGEYPAQAGLLKVTIQYAVFTADNFYEALGTQLPDPDPDYTKYVYAYQIVNGTSSNNQTVSYISVGLGLGNGASGAVQYDDGGTYTPDFFLNSKAGPPYVSLIGNYGSPIPVSGKSQILLFESPHSPIWTVKTTVKGVGLTKVEVYVPTPGSVPEPMTLASLAVAGLLLATSRRLRRSLFP